MQPHPASNHAPALISAVATADKSPRRAINAAPRGLPATTKEEEERGAGEERRGRMGVVGVESGFYRIFRVRDRGEVK